MLQKVSESEISQQEGFVGLYVFESKPKTFEYAVTLGMEAWGESLPVKLSFLHIICPSSTSWQDKDDFFKLVTPVALRVVGNFHESTSGHPTSSKYNIQVGKTPQELLPYLARTGISQQGAPRSLGGGWDRLRFGECLHQFDGGGGIVGIYTAFLSSARISPGGNYHDGSRGAG